MLILMAGTLILGGLGRIVLGSEPVAHEKEIGESIRSYVADRLAISSGEIEVRLLGEYGEVWKADSFPARFTVREANGTSLLGNASYLLISDEPGPKNPPVWVHARSEWIHPVVVAARPLKKFQILGPEDIAIETIRSDQKGNYFSETDQVIGKRSIQQERPGTVLTPEKIEEPPVIHQGDRVTLLVETGNVRIMASGKALEDGFRGKLLSVLNMDSHRTVYGEAADGGTVRIKSER